MTNWTDLIDTDPVGAYKEWDKVRNQILGTYPTANEIRLMANLAALCEEFATQLAAAKYGLGHTDYATKDRAMKLALMGCRKPDGTRRFPEIKR